MLTIIVEVIVTETIVTVVEALWAVMKEIQALLVWIGGKSTCRFTFAIVGANVHWGCIGATRQPRASDEMPKLVYHDIASRAYCRDC